MIYSSKHESTLVGNLKKSALLQPSDYLMASEGRERLFRRKDDKYLVYLPKGLAEDSMFPFKGRDTILVIVSFTLSDSKLLVEK